MKGTAGLIRKPDVSLNFPPFTFTGIFIAHILTVSGDQFPQCPAALHGFAHDSLVSNSDSVIGERDNIGCQNFQIREFPAFLADGDGSIGQHGNRSFADEVKLHLQVRHTVRNRIQVRHGADGSVTRCGRCFRSCQDGLFIRKTRFTKMHVHVAKTGKQNVFTFVETRKCVVKALYKGQLGIGADALDLVERHHS